MMRDERKSALAALKNVTMEMSAKVLTRRGLAITLPRGYLSGPRLLSKTIPRPGDCWSQNQESWRRTNMAAFICPRENASSGRSDFSTSEPPRHQSGRPRSPVADRAPPRRVCGGPLRLPRLRVRQGRSKGPHHERPYEPEATPGPRDSRRRTLAAAEHPGRRLLGRPGRGVERLAPRKRVLLPDGGDGRTGRSRPGALHVPEGTELLDSQDGEDHGELLRPRRHDVLVGEARRACERREPTQPDRHGLYQPAVRHQTHEEFPRGLVLLRRCGDLDGPRREHPSGPAERDREPVLDRHAREGAPRPHDVEELQPAPDDR